MLHMGFAQLTFITEAHMLSNLILICVVYGHFNLLIVEGLVQAGR